MARPWAARTLGVAAAALVSAFAAFSGPGGASAQTDPVTAGRSLYVESCASCHGVSGEGTEHGPDLTEAGAAAAHFYLTTGRMPLASSEDQAVRKEPAFTPDEVDLIVAFVGSLGEGPPVPVVNDAAADLQRGAELYVSNCAPCHGATASGGAAGRDALAPGLHRATPVEVAEAIEIGPGQMPVFGFTDADRDAIVSYVRYLDTADDPGGADIGGVGPVPEGFVAWGVGMVALLLATLVVGGVRRR